MKPSGAKLRDEIAALLRIHHSKVEVEVKVGTTTADVFYVDDTHPLFPRRFAIESKDWKKPLTSKNLADIYNLYRPSIGNSIDFLWIIGRHPLSGQARTSLATMDKVEYSTIDQFESSLINLQPVLIHNVISFKNDGAFSTFVQTRVKDSKESLFDHVINWLASNKIGLAVYGGYGLGKTTFSKYLAYRLSSAHLEERTGRIPIRFNLGDIYQKQDIEALVSSSLAAAEGGVQVRNFTYSLFIEMNRLGKLLLIFDGFDEMRHAIDLDDFIFNFKQLRSLMTDKAKVIILGRPDGFLSHTEEVRVLSALFEDPSTTSELLDRTEVAFFSPEKIASYIESFASSRNLSVEERAKVSSILKMIESDGTNSILARPVQLKMFTEVIDELTQNEAIPSRYTLYETFIYRFIIREQAKKSRELGTDSAKIGRDSRALFMQSAAWWILNTKRENKFTAAEFPQDLIPVEIRRQHGTDAAVREALLGSVIEPMDNNGVLGSKGGRFYFFPHKSYIEFLVAQYYSYSEFSPSMHRVFMENATEEVLSFVADGPHSGLENLRSGLEHATGRIPQYVVSAAALAPSVAKDATSEAVAKAGPAKLYTYYFYLANTGDAGGFLRKHLTISGVPGRMLTLVNCVGDCLKRNGDRTLARALTLNFLTSVFDGHRLRDYLGNGTPVHLYHDDDTSVKAGALLSAVEISATEITVYPDKLMDFALGATAATMCVELPAHGSHRKITLTLAELMGTPDTPREHYHTVITALAEKSASGETNSLPILLRGDAEHRYSLSRAR